MRQDDHGLQNADLAARTDLVFDFSGVGHVDLAGLSILLTARQLAHLDQRDVWVRGLPDDTWRVLYALGLQGYFRLFPQMIGPQE